jgi:ATP-dependent RNA helicase SUPV3L1/SUV3
VESPVTPGETPLQAEGGAPEQTAAIPAEEGELVELEVWRPQRKRNPDAVPRHRRARNGAPGEAGTAVDANAPAEKREFRRPRADKNETPEGRNDNRKHAKRNDRDQRQGGDRGKGDFDKRGRGKPDRDRNERQTYSAKPPRREREIDPDSPFAALAVLKERVQNNS